IFIFVDPALARGYFGDERGELRLLERRRGSARLALGPAAFLPTAVRPPYVLAGRDLGHRAAARDAGHALVDQRITIRRLGIFVRHLLEHPWFGLFARTRLQAEHYPLTFHPFALEREVQVSVFDGLARVLAGRGNPAALVPKHDGAAAIFARRDCALEAAIVERMVLGPHCQP